MDGGGGLGLAALKAGNGDNHDDSKKATGRVCGELSCYLADNPHFWQCKMLLAQRRKAWYGGFTGQSPVAICKTAKRCLMALLLFRFRRYNYERIYSLRRKLSSLQAQEPYNNNCHNFRQMVLLEVGKTYNC